MAFISKLKLKNFLSFKEEQEFTFDSTVNIVCGRNGSGKSNVYMAFCHIFTDMYDKQPMTERIRTIFDSGKHGSEAHIVVEVIGRETELENNNISVIEKTITSYKQQLFFNEQPISREDLTISLEALGFQCLNKYLILKQGQIMSAKDFDGDGLLKIILEFFKIGESKVWDSKCRNVHAVCKEKQRLVMSNLNPRQQLYSSFQEKLNDYDKSSSLNVLGSAISKKINLAEHGDAAADIERISKMVGICEFSRDQLLGEKEELLKDVAQINTLISKCHSEKNAVMDKIDYNEEEKFKKCAAKKNNKAALDDVKFKLDEVTGKKTAIRNQIAQASNDLDIAQNDFNLLQREVNETVASEKDNLFKKIVSISKDLNKKKELKMLLQNGSSQQRTVEINSEIQKLMELLDEEKAKAASLDIKHAQMETDIQSTNEAIEGYKSKISHLDETIAGTKGRIEGLLTQRNAITPYLDEIKKSLIDHPLPSSPSEEYYGKLGRYGLKAIEKHFNYKNFFDIKGNNYSQYADTYLGTICDVFDCNDDLARKCVQLAVSKSTLLGIVVGKTDEAKAVKNILDEVGIKEKTDIYPLESYRETSVQRVDEPDVQPLIDVLSFEKKFKNLMIATFGNWYIVDNLERARTIIKEYGINCITRDNFSVYKRGGPIECGSYSTPRNTIEDRRKFLQDQEDYVKELTSYERLQSGMITKNRELDTISGQINTLGNELNSIEEEKTAIEYDLYSKVTRLKDLERCILYVDKDIQSTTEKMNGLDLKISELTDIRDTKMDKQDKENLFKEIDNLEGELKRCSDQMNALVKRNKSLLKLSELGEKIEFLKGQHETFTKMLNDDMNEGPLSTLKNELQQQIKDLENDIKILEDIGENLSDNKSEIELKYAELNKEKESLTKSLNNVYANIDKFMCKIKDLQQQLDKYNGHNERLSQYQLTVQEEHAFKEYENSNIDELKEELRKINSRLESVSLLRSEYIEEIRDHINDYNSMLDSSTTVSNDLEELSNTIEILSTGKDQEFIEGSKFIFAHAGTLFKRFFPNGKIELSFTCRRSVSLERLTIKDLKGIKEKVKTSDTGGYIECGLSGGQKNVISLCLIIACHIHFSCPFMCFDEIEADLDPVFRTVFVEIIRDLLSKNQIFITTFREETTQIGGTFYEITSTDEGSVASRINKEQALELIER
uniref:Structural maintenance of chromosomes protein n=1 Tax=Strongyloides papillosus TaxID=174720 RepID=A0A0N5B610_STREA